MIIIIWGPGLALRSAFFLEKKEGCDLDGHPYGLPQLILVGMICANGAANVKTHAVKTNGSVKKGIPHRPKKFCKAGMVSGEQTTVAIPRDVASRIFLRTSNLGGGGGFTSAFIAGVHAALYASPALLILAGVLSFIRGKMSEQTGSTHLRHAATDTTRTGDSGAGEQ